MQPTIPVRLTLLAGILLAFFLHGHAQVKNLTNFTFDPGVGVGFVLRTDLHPNGIVMLDLDGDGKRDIATPNNFGITGLPGSISIIRNISTTRAKAAFAAAFPLATGWYTNALAAGDLDGDGKPGMPVLMVAPAT